MYSSVTKISEAIRKKKVSSQEIVKAYLDRIDQVNPKLNAVVQLAAQEALDQALKADKILASGKVQDSLHSIPMT